MKCTGSCSHGKPAVQLSLANHACRNRTPRFSRDAAVTETLTGCHVTVNGRSRPFTGPAHTSALDWLRDQGLTGAKEGCAEGECGACSILVARPG
ncbi:2Fe-2S iron-sulfur cluster-binding protein, partial [Tsukamurella hominis]|uniref:2Fe-2S iron-sulfur cluster-binding protein n=1 Tax=Tsukamurella hominis TaxID=1970232 RepID=UPI0039EAC6BF